MIRTRAVLVPWLCAVLAACGVDANLGRHEPALREDDGPQDATQTGGDPGAPREPAEEPIAPPSVDAGATASPAPDVEEDAALPEPPPEEPNVEEPPPEEPVVEEPPPEEPPVEEPPPEEPPPELPMACTAATDNPCLSCEQDACCDALHACSENEVCHCRLECRGTSEPGACAEGCGAAPDVLHTLDTCIAEHCAEQCPL